MVFVAIVVLEVNCYLGHVKKWNGMEWNGDNQARTNNAVESFHESLRRRIKVPHPYLFAFLGYLQQNNLIQSVERQQNYVTRLFIFCTCMFFSVTKKPLFGLQACVGNYQKITNTNATANNPPIYKNKGRHYFCNAIIITVYSIRRIRTSIAK